ncbi:serine/threonine-protein kinase mTOR [Discoglossus pictus]
MSGIMTMLQQFANGLRSKSEETRTKAAKDLQHYVTTELREVSQEEATQFYDELNHFIFEFVSSSDVSERKGGILAIVSLIGVEGGNATRISRFANYLRNLLPSSDTAVMEMASKAMGRLAMAGDTFTAEYVEFEVKRALEWLGADRNEGRRHAAVLVLRELAVSAPTFFFQQVQPFFDSIFYGVWDPKQGIREGAVAALRACLILTTQREPKELQKPQWYRQTFEEAERGFDETLSKEKGMNRDERIHGALLILNELVRISSMEGERLREEMEEITQQQLVHDKHCKDLMTYGLKPRHITPFATFQSVQPQPSNALLSLLGYTGQQGILGYGTAPMPDKSTLVESRTCRELVEEKFDQICRWVLKCRSSKNPLIQMTILNILPRLAAFRPSAFTADQYLPDTMSHLLSCVRKEKERTVTFLALGLIAVAVRSEIRIYLPKILEHVKSALPPKDFAHKRQKIMQVDATVFTCISMLARAMGPSIQQDVKELLEPMLSVGLSPALTAVLYDLSRHIPQLKKDIQDGLLKMLSLVLMHKPLRHPGMPKGLAHQLSSPSLTNIPEASDVGSITLALRTLGTFEFEGHSLTQFVRHCADHFLNSEHKEIRMEAARTCSRLLTPSIQLLSGHGHVSQTAVQVVADVLSKLLVVGITDPDPDIRYCVLASLDERFDTHLAQAENLQALFVALNDEVFEIRELAICTIGRLSSMNPAFVMPFLRKMLIQILTELEHSGVGRNKEQSARMLGHLVSNAPRLIRPYMEPILKALIMKLRDPDPNPGVITNVLATIGELAQVSGLEMRKWMDELFPIIMDMLQDSSLLAKRQVALWTLGQLVASTGYVVEPYRKYPSLLEVLLNFLKTEQNQGIRREAIRVLGLLGALDPYKHKVNIGMIDQSRDASALSLSESKVNQDSADYSTSEMLVNMGNLPLDEFYPAVSVVTLMRILRDQSLSNHHTMVVQAITFIFKSLGLKCVQFLPQVMPTFLSVIRLCDNNVREVRVPCKLSFLNINNKLQQPEAASGVLEFAMKHYGELEIQATWYEKLHEWEDALAAYEKKLEVNKDDSDLILGRMRCLEALGEWGQLHQQCCDNWTNVNEDAQAKMARMAAAAAWGLEQWHSMEEYTCLIPRDTHDGAFYRAVLALHQDLFSLAQQCIDKARDMLDAELTAMAGESYSRAYGAMVTCQMLSELEEVIQYKLVPERREIIRQTWWDRLQGCQRIVEDWQKILMVQSLVVSPHEDMRTWLKYASLCSKSGRLALSHKTLVMLLGVDPALESDQPVPTAHPQVTYAYMKYMWKSTRKIEAFQRMQRFVNNVQLQAQRVADDPQQKQELQKLMARCFLKLGEWQLNLQGINECTIPNVLEYYNAATEHDVNWYKAWHAWAVMNFESVLHFKQKNQQNQQNQPRDEKKVRHPSTASANTEGSESESEGDSNENSPVPSPVQKKPPEDISQTLLIYTVPAVQGFFRSISLSRGNNLQDTLRVLTLWFDYGHWPDVNEALVEGIKTIQIDTWLQVIPQLIARIDTPRPLVGRLIHQLLTDIGRYHPQALIYPLTVASKSTTTARHNAANKILKNMCEHSNTLVQQAVMVSEELIRVAILWHEMWHEGLEEASRLYFGERNVKGMFAVLDPLHAMMERGPQTLKETSFNQAYGRDLMEAQDWCRKYMKSGNVKDLTQAWDLYYHVFRRISKQLPQLTSLELQYVSPKLLMCRDLELAVPGTYDPNQPIIRIQSIAPSLQVITSKQRPRKLTLMGSNGHEFMFLLKGHEDLRQDERVMQLFGLVNTLLANDPASLRKNLSIQRYAVIPLSTNSGLIGWVPHCDTLHALIRDYREKKKILLNIEHRIMLRMAPDYDHLTLMQKVEVFEHAVNNTAGDDLAKLLWLKSPSSEVWFDRRTNYTRSLAVMSMVGYILGLGDRHPSNLMLDRLSGKILHIDFGDCFEVAMTREKFPEKIPFRLTRMLTNAMEVTGLDGNYRITCHTVMEVLREHRDSVMAVLEAFVYDPLLNWRLMDKMLETVELGETAHKKPGSTVPESIHTFIGDGLVQPEALNKKAIQIINRVRDKLTGRDFSHEETLDVATQVELLIKQATSHENLCQCYIGWCPFW